MGVTESLDHAPFHLSGSGNRIDRNPAIHRHDQSNHRHLTRLHVDLDLGELCRIGGRRGGSDVGSGRHDLVLLGLVQRVQGHLGQGHEASVERLCLPFPQADLARSYPQHERRPVGDLAAHLLGGLLDRHARHISGTRRVGAHVERSHVGVGGVDDDLFGPDP